MLTGEVRKEEGRRRVRCPEIRSEELLLLQASSSSPPRADAGETSGNATDPSTFPISFSGYFFLHLC